VFDEDGTRRFLEVVSEFKPIRKNRRAIALVANRVRPRTRAAQRLEQFLGELGAPPVAWLRDAAAYSHLAAAGRSVFDESDAKSKAALEDWRPLLAFLDDALGG
jgi:chromosome partitioning protein